MFPLWSNKRKLKKQLKQKQQKTIQCRPSLKHNSDCQMYAQRNSESILVCKSIEETSLFASFTRQVKASMTVEAAVLLPLFLFFFLNLGCAIELIRLHSNLEFALCDIGNSMTVYGYALSEIEQKFDQKSEQQLDQKSEQQPEKENTLLQEIGDIAFSYAYIKNKIVDELGQQYLEESPIVNGVNGLQFLESEIFDENDYFEVVVTYKIEPFSDVIGFGSFRMANRYYGHLWTGYKIPGTDEENADEDVVYVTKHGVVYHENRNCSYLVLSIREVSLREASESRNAKGEKYELCMLCRDIGVQRRVYITEDGENIHYTKDCIGLKRTIYALSRTETKEYRPCTRCTQ